MLYRFITPLLLGPLRLLNFHHSNLDPYYIFLPWVVTRHRIMNFNFKNQRIELKKTIKIPRRPNLNEQRWCDSNILTVFRNGIRKCNIITITVTLTTFDLIYSKFSERCPTPSLGIAITPPTFIRHLKVKHVEKPFNSWIIKKIVYIWAINLILLRI